MIKFINFSLFFLSPHSYAKLSMINLKICVAITSITLFSCTSDEISEFELSIVNPEKAESKHWVRLQGLPKFDVVEHSDGCSGGMSTIYSKLKFLHKQHGKTLQWRECCEVHDLAYYYGGSKNEKKIADEKLNLCVSKVVGNKFFGKTMKIAVEIGGGPYLPTSYRWGYGEDFR